MNTDQPRDKDTEFRDKAAEKIEEFAGKAGVMLDEIKERGREFLDKHEESIDSTIDKVAGYVDDRTKGRYHDKIETVAEKAKEAVGRLAGDPSETPDRATPAQPPSFAATEAGMATGADAEAGASTVPGAVAEPVASAEAGPPVGGEGEGQPGTATDR